MTTAFAHIPKRVTQHGMFVSSEEIEPPTLKPGQKDLHRKGLYVSEAKRAFAATTYLTLDLPSRTEYSASSRTEPDHYAHRDELARRAQEQTSSGSNCLTSRSTSASSSTTCAHWQSEYKAVGAEAGGASAEHRAAARGVIRVNPVNKVGFVGCAEDGTAYRDHIGRYGSNPRDRVRPDDSTLPVFKHELIAGTTRASNHIPNYQGFLPCKPSNPASARAASGQATRSIDKTNMADIIHRNVIGYSGHVPESFLNDFGGRKPTSLTTHGRDFAPLKSARF